MAKAELRRPDYPWICPDGRRTHTTAHCYDHCLSETVRPDRVVEEELVG